MSDPLRVLPNLINLRDEWGSTYPTHTTRGWVTSMAPGAPFCVWYLDRQPLPMIVVSVRGYQSGLFSVDVDVVPYLTISDTFGQVVHRSSADSWVGYSATQGREGELCARSLSDFPALSAHTVTVFGSTLFDARSSAMAEGARLLSDLEWLYSSIYSTYRPYGARPLRNCPAGIVHPGHFDPNSGCMCGVFEYESTQRKVWGAPSWVGRYRKHLVRTWREMRKLKVLGVDFGSHELDKLDDRSP